MSFGIPHFLKPAAHLDTVAMPLFTGAAATMEGPRCALKRISLLFVLVAVAFKVCASSLPELEKGFLNPPDSARPWIFWFWLGGNITSNGITADLEAMKRVGIGGVVIMDVEQGTPKGPVEFASEPWLRLFKHMCGEADRLGLKVSMNNDGGWTGSGGPWITPELSMQKLAWSETNVKGPTNFNAPLPQAVTVTKFYRDIAVMALPNTEADSPRMKDFSPRIKASVMGADFQQAKLLD